MLGAARGSTGGLWRSNGVLWGHAQKRGSRTKRVLASSVLHGSGKTALHACSFFKRSRPLGVDHCCCIKPCLLLGCQAKIWPGLM